MSSENRSSLERTLQLRLSDREARSQFRRLATFPSTSVDFSSNSYLSLSLVPEVRQAYLSYLETLNSSPSLPLLGSGGSRLLDGNSTVAEDLELDIAAFHGAPAGLLFNSGLDANVGLFSCVPQPGDIIVYDELVHASTHDGMKLSRAGRRMPFAHNRVSALANGEDSKMSLSEVLEELTRDGKEVREGTRNVFVAVEGVYSMDGDLAPLREIVDCLQRFLPNGNGHLIVDEAHSTGLFGKGGRGLVSDLGLEKAVFARVHTFGKAMGSSGAIVLCSPVAREYLINYARTLIYTTALPPTSLASIKVTYDFLPTPPADALRTHLHELTKYAHGLFSSISSRHQGAQRSIRLDPGAPRSPIIPILTASPRSLAQHCQQKGFVVRPIVAPTVPKGSERVRVCLHAANTRQEVEGLAAAVEEWVRQEAQDDATSTRTQKPRL